METELKVMDKKEEIHSPLNSKKEIGADEGIGERKALKDSVKKARETLVLRWIG